MTNLFSLIKDVADFLWGPQMLVFILGSGIYFSLRLKGVQFGRFPEALREFKKSKLTTGDGNITPFQALMSALSGMVGNGNIAGVATAIVIGGPGAIFWMWVSALILMATMYSESLLGCHFREKEKDGTYMGGPMVYIKKGLNIKWLSTAFAIAFAVKTLIATTSIQSNSMSIILKNEFGTPQLLSCLVIAFLTWLVIIGGLKKIARTAEYLTPFMTIFYILGGLLVLIINSDQLLNAFKDIFFYAFNGYHAVEGGFAGTTVLMALRYGTARGAYSNEAGTGSVAIMHATAQSGSAVKQSLISMISVFIDTIIICTISALVILTSGIWSGGLNSTALASESFSSALSIGNWIVLAASLLFGYSTLITWSFYGEQCASYLFGDKIKIYYRWLFCAAIMLGATSKAESIWSLGDLLNGITVIINLIGILLLSPVVIKLTLGKNKITS
ncbi:MAG: sodium:alanine symporter family protein [Ignavibacteriaceae bacterium]